jgi:DNA-binding MarR family transcriptional regulator
LHEQGELTAAALAAECAILAPSMTRIIRRLSSDGYVLVNRSRDDQRELNLKISAKGKRLVDRLGPSIEAAYADIRDQMEPEHMAALYRELGRFITRVDTRSTG